MNGKPLINIKNMSFSYGSRRIIRNFSLQVNEGEFIGIAGANGSGKTTLLKLIAGSLIPEQGMISIGTKKYIDHSMIGVVYQETFLSRSLTVLENLRFYSTIFKVKKKNEKIDEVISLLGLEPYRNHLISSLSKGYEQRVSLARAILHEPKILLLDEPFDGLDLTSTEMIMNYLSKQKERNISCLCVCHDLPQLYKLCDKTLFLMERGRTNDIEHGSKTKKQYIDFAETIIRGISNDFNHESHHH